MATRSATGLGNQGRPYRKGTLDPERRARLEALPGWAWDAREAEWEEGFASLQRFVEREGHARVPRGHRENSHKLDSWVLVQRQCTSKGHAQRWLVAIGWRAAGLDVGSREADVGEGFSRLERFVNARGMRNPTAVSRGRIRIGIWVYSQRQRRRRGTLDAEEIRSAGVTAWLDVGPSPKPTGRRPSPA